MTPAELTLHLARLPHGPGFRFIDELLSLDPGMRGCGIYRVRGDEPFLAAHFPGQPMMPGVLMIEAVAQLAGIVAQGDPGNPRMEDLRLAAVRSAKIRGTAVPGETLTIEASVDGRLGGLVQARGTVTVGGAEPPVVECHLTLSGVVA